MPKLGFANLAHMGALHLTCPSCFAKLRITLKKACCGTYYDIKDPYEEHYRGYFNKAVLCRSSSEIYS